MRLVTLLLALAATSTSAQTVETPVPFDNSGRVLVVTPRLVDSLRLAAAWPVRSEFTSARLFRQSSGGYVIVVERASGDVERHALLDEQRQALALAFTGAPSAAAAPAPARPVAAPVTTLPAATDSSVAAEQRADRLRNRYIGSQMGLGALVFSPLVGSTVFRLTDDRAVASM